MGKSAALLSGAVESSTGGGGGGGGGGTEDPGPSLFLHAKSKSTEKNKHV